MYDVLVIGAGPGGYVAAIKAAQLGAKTAIIDRDKPGGVCLNYGCIPTKALLASAKRLQEVKKSHEYGIEGVNPGAIAPNWKSMLARKDQIVAKLNAGVSSLLKKNGVEWIQGEAVVQSPQEVTVGDKVYRTKKLILATGAKEVYPEIEGIESLLSSDSFYNSARLLRMPALPKEMLVIGGGTIPVEFAVLFQSLGVSVTLLHRSDRILQTFDEELSRFMLSEMKKIGIKVLAKVQIDRFEENRVFFRHKEKEQSLRSDCIHLTLGYAPNEKGLEKLKLKKDERGFIQTDAFLRTGTPDVFAIGDLIGRYALAHVASHEGLAAAVNATGGSEEMRYDQVPTALYTFPELASVGLTEKAARAAYPELSVNKFPLGANGRALAEGETSGFVKILTEPKYGEVVGVHIAGANATEMIAEGVLALRLESTAEDLARIMHAHPTPGEIVMEAALGAIGSPLHK